MFAVQPCDFKMYSTTYGVCTMHVSMNGQPRNCKLALDQKD